MLAGRNAKRRYAFAAMAGLAMLAAIGFAVVGRSIAVSDEADIQVNSAGQTYGVPEGTDGDSITMPDLVRVEATNGKMGYVNYAEMNEIAGNYVLPDGRDAAAAAFQDAINEYYGTEIASEEDGLQSYSIAAYYDPSLESDEVELGKLVSEPLAEAMRSGSLSKEKTVEIISDSLAAGTLSDAAKASLVEESAGFVAAIEGGTAFQRNGGAGVSEMLDGVSFAGIEASDISMSERAYESIYLLAREKMSVSIPVYDEDGITVIGEYILNRI